MNKSMLVTLFSELNADLSDHSVHLEEIFRNNLEKTLRILNCSFDEIAENTARTDAINVEKQTYEWKYICMNFYILQLLNQELSKSDTEVLSVQETKNVKSALQNLILHGILKNLQPNLPHRVKIQKSNTPVKDVDVLYDYSLLKSTVIGLDSCMKYPNLRMLILPHYLQPILVACFQIAYCALKKPEKKNDSKFFMTEERYNQLLQDQIFFKNILDKMSTTVYPSLFIKETMVLFQANAPLWFKKAISNRLTTLMKSKKGIQHIAVAMLDGCDDDTTKTWNTLDVLTKIIISCRTLPDFQDNICAQLLNLLNFTQTTNELLVFERLVVSCTKCLYLADEEFCKTVFIVRITNPLLELVNKDHKFRDHVDITDNIKQSVRLLHGCFVENSVNSACLPMTLIRSFINVIFYLYHLGVKSTFRSTIQELKELLVQYLRNCSAVEIHELLDNFLFGFTVADVYNFRNDVVIEIDEKMILKTSPHSIIYATADVMDTLYDLFDTNQKIILFGYLLKSITEKEKYFLTAHNSKELLGNEDHATSTVLERLLTIHKLLSQLAENKDVQDSLKSKPDDIIGYINNVLSSETNDPQLLFIIVMILDNLIMNASANAVHKYRTLEEPLTNIMVKTKEAELKTLCAKVLTTLKKGNYESPAPESHATEFDKALEDVYDTLLPTRGHGLLVLSKLVEKKDKQAMERKQYLLNLFQLHLKDEDSFIYLNAVQGLVALANVFPDTILEILCEQYSDFAKKDAEETRMKLGEVLVRLVKLLGDLAPKYKSLLLNTFLSGTKDEDHLIRASSLSNLGEVCRVLNYKLGTIVTEVLVCVHAIIATDKAIEARRSAVTVIRQLFVGLQSEMITFLKEDILPIYRTLKEVYHNDGDDVMRLHAQLALEELNENMKSIVFPAPQLHLDKKIIMLD